MTENALTINLGGTEHPLANIPMHNLCVLAQRAANHIFGNEKASFIKGRADKAVKDGTPLTEDQTDALENEFIEAKAKIILEGTLGSRAAGVPKASRLERIMRAMVRVAIEHSPGVKSGAVVPPKKSEKGSGDWWNAMVDKVLSVEANKTAFTAKAQAEMDRQDAEAAMLGGIDLSGADVDQPTA